MPLIIESQELPILPVDLDSALIWDGDDSQTPIAVQDGFFEWMRDLLHGFELSFWSNRAAQTEQIRELAYWFNDRRMDWSRGGPRAAGSRVEKWKFPYERPDGDLVPFRVSQTRDC